MASVPPLGALICSMQQEPQPNRMPSRPRKDDQHTRLVVIVVTGGALHKAAARAGNALGAQLAGATVHRALELEGLALSQRAETLRVDLGLVHEQV